MRSFCLLALSLVLSASSFAGDFVRATPTGFERGGQPYRFLGTNLWYGMNMGSSGQAGDRKRLVRELDRLQAYGVTNLRIMGATEGPDSEPWRIVPALQTAPGNFREELLSGLDFLLSEMGARKMTAVICLGDFWPWSGGMSQFLSWAGAGGIPYPPPAAGGDWTTYQLFTQQFYSNDLALDFYRETVRKIVTRYKGDSTILAWELANEPRGVDNVLLFNHWIDASSSFIKTLDPNHLVTTGSEGETPWPQTSGMDFVANHSFTGIDYATAHIWAGNWGWFDPAQPQATYAAAVAKMKDYFQDHLAKAKRLGKPLVIEEFGLARDGGSFDPDSLTTYRDRYYTEVFDQVFQAAAAGAPVAGVNFWAWAGEARPVKPFGGYWKSGDPFVGDPPHEQQGWYSVYDRDQSTIQIISRYARRILKLKRPAKGRRPASDTELDVRLLQLKQKAWDGLNQQTETRKKLVAEEDALKKSDPDALRKRWDDYWNLHDYWTSYLGLVFQTDEDLTAKIRGIRKTSAPSFASRLQAVKSNSRSSVYKPDGSAPLNVSSYQDRKKIIELAADLAFYQDVVGYDPDTGARLK